MKNLPPKPKLLPNDSRDQMSKGLILLLILLCGCEAVRVTAPSTMSDGRSERFAILFTASDWREGEADLVDDSGLNATWLQTQRIHASLRQAGVANIATLYLDGRPDPAEPQIANSAIQSASKYHLRQSIAAFAARMDADDHLTIHLSMHGLRDTNTQAWGQMWLEVFRIEVPLVPNMVQFATFP